MNPYVKSVEPLENYQLKLHFENGDLKLFDVSPYLDKGVFKELKDNSYFKSVRVVSGAVQWPHEQDFSNDTLYIRSTPLSA
ncbi:MAG: hypothetical protein RL497_2197 [Pseudomonadota bacterium]|jgi:hypothetical protein